jgi:Oxidoreductase family, NAD-binding Rossmann fold
MNLTRRDFAKLSALGLAARFAPNLHVETSAPRKTGYCVIGLGRIASHFMPAVRSTTTSQITGLVSGHRDKAERIAAEYRVPTISIYNYENFDEIAHNPAIDAVYVALPTRCTPSTQSARLKPANTCFARSRCRPTWSRLRR